MGQPFIGEIRMFGGSFAPAGWAFCNGALLPISENDALFTLIGTIYGGDGQETFALPNLQSRLPLHQGTGPSGNSYIIGEAAGVESVTLCSRSRHTLIHRLHIRPPETVARPRTVFGRNRRRSRCTRMSRRTRRWVFRQYSLRVGASRTKT